MAQTKRTIGWSKKDLVDERFYYFAHNGQIERVYFPGGGAIEVAHQSNKWIQLVTGRMMRLPMHIRNYVPELGC